MSREREVPDVQRCRLSPPRDGKARLGGASLLFLLLILVVFGLDACGGSTKRGNATVSRESQQASTAVAAAPPRLPKGQLYLNDGDKDPSSDEDPDDLNGKKTDEDNDPREDHVPTQNNSYHDSDDDPIVHLGRPASDAERHAVSAIVERYDETAVKGDGATACGLMYSITAEDTPEDFGRAPGPAYLRGSKTCQEVMMRLFAHVHSELVGTFAVTGVRISGTHGVALLGSKTMPASFLDVRREHGVWKIASLLPEPLH